MKEAVVNAALKSGDKLDHSNYEPISHMSILSKILEKIIQTRMSANFNRYKIPSYKK